MTWWSIVAVYTLLGLLFTGQVWIDYAYSQHPISWSRAAMVALGQWYLWAVITPGVVWLARRFRFDTRRWPLSLAVHLPVSLVCTVAKQIADTLGASFITGIARGPFSFIAINVAFLTYWAIVGVAHAMEQYRQSRERELQAARLESALARSELQSLRMQLHPHFLFNTLNAIAALMREDVEAADVMMARLGDLLRATLASTDLPEVPLRRELELVQMYFDIQQARMGDRLTTRIDAATDTLDAAVPTLILQPIVENAIRHGAGARPGPARVDVRARRDGEVLILEVQDDGPGPPAEGAASGHGLRNTRARLTAACGPDATFTLTPAPNGGALVRVTMRLRDVADAEPATA